MSSDELHLTPGPGVLEGALLEGLARALKPEGDFAQELKAAGYDLLKPKPQYPDAVWRQMLVVSARHRFAGKTYQEAERLLGNSWIAGARQTLVGQVVLGTLPLMSVSTLIDRVPRLLAIATPNMKGEILEKRETHRTVKFILTDLAPTPYFMAGVLESVVGEKRRCTVGVSQLTSRSYVLSIDW
jgi:uncharacterized protein (TIGR02265 family)